MTSRQTVFFRRATQNEERKGGKGEKMLDRRVSEYRTFRAVCRSRDAYNDRTIASVTVATMDPSHANKITRGQIWLLREHAVSEN